MAVLIYFKNCIDYYVYKIIINSKESSIYIIFTGCLLTLKIVGVFKHYSIIANGVINLYYYTYIILIKNVKQEKH